MKHRLKHLASFYLDSFWLPAVLCGTFVFLATFIFFEKKLYAIGISLYDPPRPNWAPWLPNPFFMMGLAVLSIVGLLQSFFWKLVNRRWLKAVGTLAVCFVMCILLTVATFHAVWVRHFGPLLGIFRAPDPAPADEIQPPEDAP